MLARWGIRVHRQRFVSPRTEEAAARTASGDVSKALDELVTQLFHARQSDKDSLAQIEANFGLKLSKRALHYRRKRLALKRPPPDSHDSPNNSIPLMANSCLLSADNSSSSTTSNPNVAPPISTLPDPVATISSSSSSHLDMGAIHPPHHSSLPPHMGVDPSTMADAHNAHSSLTPPQSGYSSMPSLPYLQQPFQIPSQRFSRQQQSHPFPAAQHAVNGQPQALYPFIYQSRNVPMGSTMFASSNQSAAHPDGNNALPMDNTHANISYMQSSQSMPVNSYSYDRYTPNQPSYLESKPGNHQPSYTSEQPMYSTASVPQQISNGPTAVNGLPMNSYTPHSNHLHSPSPNSNSGPTDSLSAPNSTSSPSMAHANGASFASQYPSLNKSIFPASYSSSAEDGQNMQAPAHAYMQSSIYGVNQEQKSEYPSNLSMQSSMSIKDPSQLQRIHLYPQHSQYDPNGMTMRDHYSERIEPEAKPSDETLTVRSSRDLSVHNVGTLPVLSAAAATQAAMPHTMGPSAHDSASAPSPHMQSQQALPYQYYNPLPAMADPAQNVPQQLPPPIHSHLSDDQHIQYSYPNTFVNRFPQNIHHPSANLLDASAALNPVQNPLLMPQQNHEHSPLVRSDAALHDHGPLLPVYPDVDSRFV